MANEKFTCEVMTPLTTFDTKVNFEFENGEFDEILEKSAELLREEEEMRKMRMDERQKKKDEKKKGTTGTTEKAVVPIIADMMEYQVEDDGTIKIFVQANKELDETSWLINSQSVDSERHQTEIDGKRAILKIKEPCVDDAATYTCIMTSSALKCEASADLTGNVFKKLLLDSAEIRIKSEPDCDVTTDVENAIEVTDEVDLAS
uniref:Immunoglobulin I-set domain-containing protein n=1 Tax=Ciona savignyi TaxID=51511 RepID=H2YJI7_CIOSA